MITVRVGGAADVDSMSWARGASQLDQWRAAAKTDGNMLLVAQWALNIVGKAVLDLSARSDAAWLSLMSVDPAYRSRGIGTALLDFAATQAAAQGFRAVELAVDADNARASRLYKRLGYRRIGPHIDHVHYVDDDGAEVSYDEPGWLLRREIPSARSR